ncbi:MAG: sugar ABC transporter substrate-binding protein [Saccharofermentanales bacterium]
MKKLISILLVLAMLLSLVACGSSDKKESDTDKKDDAAVEEKEEKKEVEKADEKTADNADEDLYIVFSQYAMLSPFFVAASYGFVQQADRMGIKAVVMDAGNVLQRQIDMIDDAITQEADAIVITPMDSEALAVAVERCNEAGIPCLSIDRDILGGDLMTCLQSDNTHCGREIAREFLKRFEEEGLTEVKLIQIRGQLGSTPSRDRDKGFWEVINAQDAIKVNKVAESAADWESGKAEEQTVAHLTAHPDADAIFYEADCMAPGVFAAMEQLGLNVPKSDPDHIINGGVDGSTFALDRIKEGKMDVCVSQLPYSQGLVACYLAYHAAKYKDEDGASELPRMLYFDAQTVTPENIDSFGDSLWGYLPIGGSEIPQDLKDKLLN